MRVVLTIDNGRWRRVIAASYNPAAEDPFEQARECLSSVVASAQSLSDEPQEFREFIDSMGEWAGDEKL